MNVPVFILAGQSNVGFLAAEIEDAFEDQYGVGNFELIRVFDSGAPLTRSREQQLDWETPGELRDALTAETINALLADDDRSFGGMIWIQGEADTYTTAGADRYETRLDELFDDFRSDVSAALGDDDLGFDTAPITILELSEQAPEAENRIGWDRVIEAQRDVAQDDTLVQTLDPDVVALDANLSVGSLFRDGLHYTDDFGVLIAEELVQSLSDPVPAEDLIEEEPEDEGGADLVEDPDLPVLPVVEPVLLDEDGSEDAQPEPIDDGGGGMDGILFVLPLLGVLAAFGAA